MRLILAGSALVAGPLPGWAKDGDRDDGDRDGGGRGRGGDDRGDDGGGRGRGRSGEGDSRGDDSGRGGSDDRGDDRGDESGGSGSTGSGATGEDASGASGPGSSTSGSRAPDSGRSGKGSPGSGGGKAGRDGNGPRPAPPARIDTAAVTYADGSRESVQRGRYRATGPDGRLRETRAATTGDLRRIAGTKPGAASEIMVRMNSRDGAAEIVDRRGWREVMGQGRYMLTDPRGRVVRSRPLRPDDTARLRALLGDR